jgi:hypothetical protein
MVKMTNYQIQETPDECVILDNFAKATPIVTLSNGCTKAHIIKDDHCYVLVLCCVTDNRGTMVKYWFREAVEALQSLPLPS